MFKANFLNLGTLEMLGWLVPAVWGPSCALHPLCSLEAHSTPFPSPPLAVTGRSVSPSHQMFPGDTLPPVSTTVFK